MTGGRGTRRRVTGWLPVDDVSSKSLEVGRVIVGGCRLHNLCGGGRIEAAGQGACRQWLVRWRGDGEEGKGEEAMEAAGVPSAAQGRWSMRA